MASTILLLEAALAIGSAVAGTVVSCPTASLPLSCHNTTAADTCCVNYPGGDLLQTQFWDTDPSAGPSNSWTVHGLWPDNCDGTYDQFCDTSREVTNITAILRAASPSTLEYMQTYWKDYKGNDESFWEHEYNKHGTCISSLDPTCYDDYEPHQEVVDFFESAVALFKTLPSYEWLSDAGIVPSTTATYTLAAIQKALSAKFGHNVIINCDGSTFNELWYHYNVRGNIQTGTFVPVDPIGSKSTCPSTGIKYLPKSGTATPTTPAASTPTSGVSPTAGASSALSGQGNLYVTTSSSSTGGFLISSGTWYRSGSAPATYTATASSDGLTFTLKTSKGPCAVLSDSSLSCASSVTASTFGYDGQHLTYNSASTFYAKALPSGSTQGTVYTESQAVELQITWTAK